MLLDALFELEKRCAALAPTLVSEVRSVIDLVIASGTVSPSQELTIFPKDEPTRDQAVRHGDEGSIGPGVEPDALSQTAA